MVCFLLNQIVEEKIFRAHSRSSFEMEKSWISVKKINHSTMIDSIISISTLLNSNPSIEDPNHFHIFQSIEIEDPNFSLPSIFLNLSLPAWYLSVSAQTPQTSAV